MSNNMTNPTGGMFTTIKYEYYISKIVIRLKIRKDVFVLKHPSLFLMWIISAVFLHIQMQGIMKYEVKRKQTNLTA